VRASAAPPLALGSPRAAPAIMSPRPQSVANNTTRHSAAAAAATLLNTSISTSPSRRRKTYKIPNVRNVRTSKKLTGKNARGLYGRRRMFYQREIENFNKPRVMVIPSSPSINSNNE
jgi:hypothetical protein